jgi:hypothetical protein
MKATELQLEKVVRIEDPLHEKSYYDVTLFCTIDTAPSIVIKHSSGEAVEVSFHILDDIIHHFTPLVEALALIKEREI